MSVPESGEATDTATGVINLGPGHGGNLLGGSGKLTSHVPVQSFWLRHDGGNELADRLDILPLPCRDQVSGGGLRGEQ